MRYSMEKIGIHILAFMVARCTLLGLCPFVVPFFVAAYLQEKSTVGMYVLMMFGVFSRMGTTAVVKYSIVIVFLLVLMKKTDRKRMFADSLQTALAAGVILCAVSMPYEYIVTGKDISLVYSFLEGLIATCFVLILEQSFLALRVGTGRMFATNERFVGLFVMMTVALFGCPGMTEPVNLLYVLCSGLLLYNSYRFGSSVGMSTGAVTGLVLALEMENVNILAVMILLSSLIVLLRELGKIGVLTAYVAGHILLGYLYENSLLRENMLTSMIAVAVLFFVTPRRWLKRVAQVREGNTALSQDILIQEATKSRIDDFGQAFLAMEKMLEMHERERGAFEPQGLSNVYLSGDGISLLNVVEFQSNRLAELRKNFIRQLGQIGDVITTFPVEIADSSLQTEFFEGRINESFGKIGVKVSKALLIKDKNEMVKAYVSCRLAREQLVTGEQLEERISKVLGKAMVCMDRRNDVVLKQESRYCFVEQGKFMLTTGVVQRNRSGEALCGDNFSVTKIDTQKAVLMLSDGMGTGMDAYVKSEQVVELLEQLLSAGFCRELAVELLNSFISFLAEGEISSTLDLSVVDFYTGEVDFIKLGASTTFIKRRNTVECIRSTSLPVGVMEQVEFDTCQRKLYHGDMIIMVSDGVLDGIIFEDKEEYLADVIAKQETSNVQAMAEMIMQQVEKMQRGTMRDDSTILIAGVWER